MLLSVKVFISELCMEVQRLLREECDLVLVVCYIIDRLSVLASGGYNENLSVLQGKFRVMNSVSVL